MDSQQTRNQGYQSRNPNPNGTSNSNTLKPETVGYFNPSLKDPHNTGIIAVGKYTVFTNIFPFTDRLRQLAVSHGEGNVKAVWINCLQETALAWYSMELTDIEKDALQKLSLDWVIHQLIKAFRKSPSNALQSLKSASFTLLDLKRGKGLRPFVYSIIQDARACDLPPKIQLLYAFEAFDAEIQSQLLKPTDNTTLGAFFQHLDDRESVLLAKARQVSTSQNLQLQPDYSQYRQTYPNQADNRNPYLPPTFINSSHNHNFGAQGHLQQGLTLYVSSNAGNTSQQAQPAIPTQRGFQGYSRSHVKPLSYPADNEDSYTDPGSPGTDIYRNGPFGDSQNRDPLWQAMDNLRRFEFEDFRDSQAQFKEHSIRYRTAAENVKVQSDFQVTPHFSTVSARAESSVCDIYDKSRGLSAHYRGEYFEITASFQGVPHQNPSQISESSRLITELDSSESDPAEAESEHLFDDGSPFNCPEPPAEFQNHDYGDQSHHDDHCGYDYHYDYNNYDDQESYDNHGCDNDDDNGSDDYDDSDSYGSYDDYSECDDSDVD
ncbi:hypothetical protein GL218_04751 [Daldinia childiae]|uniref:uncharacterized protein n=1 Tax=Daldinia childiae TaxID=326645 RepID=UPI0014464AD2|nr:uncharacterized protein GL218_04751 [Daldinia childiae]KAF3059633.1 hypothetical protein GL218_04751 [Daldinia childiae]